MKQLAVCVPTYNQPEMIREMCVRCLDIYRENSIDLYIYDSSPDHETERIAAEYKRDYGNLIYSRFPADINSNIKVLRAYKEIISAGKYVYLWLCPDYIQLTAEGVGCILQRCEEEFDVCVLNYRDVERIGEKIYTDMNEFFLECAWHMSSYMATVIRISSFADVEWEAFCRRYTTPGRVCHSHVAFYFEQLSRLPEPKAVHVPVSSAQIRVSPYRKDSMWKKESFAVWGEYWPDMIRALPAEYEHKDGVIRKLGINTGIFGWRNFVALRGEKIYDAEVYCRYRRQWKKLTNVSPIGLWALAHLPACMVRRMRRPSPRRGGMCRAIRGFCGGCPEIYIYGCGFMAQKTSALLREMGIEYRGYVVSDRTREKETFNGLPVIACEELPPPSPGLGVIVALSKENAGQVAESRRLDPYQTFYMYFYEDML